MTDEQKMLVAILMGNVNAPESVMYETAQKILAAGFRYVGPDQVVVNLSETMIDEYGSISKETWKNVRAMIGATQEKK